MAQETPKVYAAISAVQEAISKEGIAKSNRNQQQGYSFRGVDDIYNAIAPLLPAHKLVIVPRMLKREVSKETSSKGNQLFYVTVEAEFDFISAVDGSKHTARTFGEAMDSGDKATNKAMSAAYKYCCIQTFCIPTEGDNDADSTTHEVATQTNAHKAEPKNPPSPDAEKFRLDVNRVKPSNDIEADREIMNKALDEYANLSESDKHHVRNALHCKSVELGLHFDKASGRFVIEEKVA